MKNYMSLVVNRMVSQMVSDMDDWKADYFYKKDIKNICQT